MPHRAANPSRVQVVLPIANIPCAGATSALEARLERVPGVITARLNFVVERAFVTYDPSRTDTAKLVAAIERECGLRVDRRAARVTTATQPPPGDAAPLRAAEDA